MASTLGTSCNGSSSNVYSSLGGNPVTNGTITFNDGINSVFPFDGIFNDSDSSDDRNEFALRNNVLYNRHL